MKIKNLAKMSMLDLINERSRVFTEYNAALRLHCEHTRICILHYIRVVNAEIMVAQAENRV
jgi:hypothetical protein